jgi:hypothetical protein
VEDIRRQILGWELRNLQITILNLRADGDIVSRHQDIYKILRRTTLRLQHAIDLHADETANGKSRNSNEH